MDVTQSTTTDWPIESRDGSIRFIFSGTLSTVRISREKAGQAIFQTTRLILILLAFSGLLALGYGIWREFFEFGLALPFAHRWYNLLFWTSILGDSYLCALLVHRHLEQRALFITPKTRALWEHQASTVDIYRLFTKEAKLSWNSILSNAKTGSLATVNTFSVLASLLESDTGKLAFLRLGISTEELIAVLKAQADRPGLASFDQNLIHQLPFLAYETAIRLRSPAIDSLLLLCTLVRSLPKGHPMLEFLFKLDVSQETLEILAVWIFNIRLLSEEYSTFKKLAKFRSDSEVDRGLTAVPTPYLDQFSEDLTRKAKYGQLSVSLGREQDVDALLGLLSNGSRNVVIKGEVGSGRSTVVEELAYRMVTEDVPRLLQDKRLIKLELSGIVGSRLPAETVLIEALSEAERSGNIALVLEDIHILAKASSGKGLSLLEILVSHIQESNLIVIGTTTLADYSDYLARTLNFDQLFSSYELEQLSPRSILLACCIRVSFLESRFGVLFTFQSIHTAISLSDQYFKDTAQPQKAIGLLTEVATRVHNAASKDKIVTEQLIQKLVAEKTHVPESSFSQAEAQKLLDLEAELAESIIGQKPAVRAVVDAMQRARSGLSRRNRPIASFLFVGPTGVGKTELAKQLALKYFGSEQYFLRLDMSEYQGTDGIEKMLGQKADTQDTSFVKHIKHFPFGLFLLDEFEKASRDVLNLFLQVFEDGRITNARGETLDLTHTIIIATSNAGTPDIQAGMKTGESLEQIQGKLFDQILMKHFAPELLNRFDGVILFTPLAPEEVQKITELQLARLAKQLLDTKGIEFNYTPAAVAEIAKKAYDPLLGARPIRRYVQDHVETLLAKLLLSQNPSRGTTITLDLQENNLIIL
jgi:ATP-dependent Clp protease ATP-binding subunit ClpC